MSTSFRHPQRFPKNVPGAFYTTGDCLACGQPEHEAPDLLAPLEGDNYDTYFVTQPETPEEVAQACAALQGCCVTALRYGGQEHAIIRRLGNNPSYCDYVLSDAGELVLTVASSGECLPAFAESVRHAEKSDCNDFALTHEGTSIHWYFSWHELGAQLRKRDGSSDA